MHRDHAQNPDEARQEWQTAKLRLHRPLATTQGSAVRAPEQSLCRLALAPHSELFCEEVYDLGLARTDGRRKRDQVRHDRLDDLE